MTRSRLRIIRSASRPTKGAYHDRRETRGGMRWTQTVLLTRAPDSGRKRRVVLAPRRWCQVRERKLSRVTVAKEPEHRGERAIIRKTIAWGMPGESGVTCMLVCAFYSILHTRPWGASSARHSLRPFRGSGDRSQAKLAQTHAARMRRCALPSLRAQRSNPAFLLAAPWIASLRSQ